jgi:hypothetical protein
MKPSIRDPMRSSRSCAPGNCSTTTWHGRPRQGLSERERLKATAFGRRMTDRFEKRKHGAVWSIAASRVDGWNHEDQRRAEGGTERRAQHVGASHTLPAGVLPDGAKTSDCR